MLCSCHQSHILGTFEIYISLNTFEWKTHTPQDSSIRNSVPRQTFIKCETVPSWVSSGYHGSWYTFLDRTTNYDVFQVPRPSGKIWGWHQTRPQHRPHRPLLQLPQEVIRKERRGGGGQCQEEGLQLVRCLLPGWRHNPHGDDVHQPKSHRWDVTPDTDQNRQTLLLNLCFPLHWAMRKRYREK